MRAGGARVVLWDFDGTLAERPGMWSGCVLEVLDVHEPGHGVELAQIAAGLHDGFPWHAAHEPHPHLCEPESWWRAVGETIAATLRGVGIAPARAAQLALATRERYVDPSCGWRLFDDALPALARLADAGWRSAVLSNHVPELPRIVAGLGLDAHFDAVFNSATSGFEKPHPEAFAGALRALGEPESVWMIGDNPHADAAGAAAAGIPSILVRSEGPSAGHSAATLVEAVEIVLHAGA